MKYRIDSLRHNRVFLQRLYMVSIAAILIIAALIVRDLAAPAKYISNDNGHVTGIIKNDSNGTEYQLELTMKYGKESSKRNITIRSRPNNKNSGRKNTISDEEISEGQREAELNGKITDIELSSKKRLTLPSKLSDGTKLIWNIPKKGNDDVLTIVILYIALLGLIVKSAMASEDGGIAEKRNIILRSLPRFTNQLLLMLNVGIILSDAFTNICNNYLMIDETKRNYFEQQMIEIESNNVDHRDSTAKLLTDFASKYNIKEMMRVATILTENERRGSDVLESLERESEFLWENRKIMATERGKALDAKMAYPLGLLLIILIIITIAPAFLSM